MCEHEKKVVETKALFVSDSKVTSMEVPDGEYTADSTLGAGID